MSRRFSKDGELHAPRLTPSGRAEKKRREREGAKLMSEVNGTLDIIRANREKSERESRERQSKGK